MSVSTRLLFFMTYAIQTIIELKYYHCQKIFITIVPVLTDRSTGIQKWLHSV